MPNRWAVVAIIVAVLGLAVGIQTLRLNASQAREKAVQASFDSFVAQTKAIGEVAAKQAKETEAKYAKQAQSAIASRDDALRRLRESATSSGRDRVPITPASAPGDSQICFEPAGFAAAVEGFRGRVQGIVTEGQAAQIDAQALLGAWPGALESRPAAQVMPR